MLDFAHIETYRENNRIEAKKALGGLPHSIWETYSAFANTLGGIILLGVEEYRDKTFHTVDLPCPEILIEDFLELLGDSKKVSVNILSEKDITVENIDGNRIVAIRVPRAPRCDKPVYIDGDPTHGTYRRNGEGDYRCTPDEVAAMLRDASVKTQDMPVLEHMSLASLDNDSIQSYRHRLKDHDRDHSYEKLDDIGLLLKLGAAGLGKDQEPHPTSAGLLMFGKTSEIIKEYPHFKLEYREDTLDAPVYFCGKNVYDFYFRTADILRGYSEADDRVATALCEALANCMTNADYRGKQGITVIRSKQNIAFSNPGGFRIDINTAKSGGVSDPRNGAMIKLFHIVDIGTGAGSGIPNIYGTWNSKGWSAPVITESFDPERITLTLTFGKDTSTEIPIGIKRISAHHKEIIVSHLTRSITASSKEIAGLLGISVPHARKLLSSMIDDGIITPEGNGKSRVYKLKN